MTRLRRPRVLHVGKFYPPHMGGMETHLENLCRGLAAAVEVAVVVAADGRRTVRETIDGVPVARLGTRLSAGSAQVTPGLAREIRQSGADLVHLHLPNPTAVLAYLASRRRGPVIATYHSDIVRQRLLGLAFEPLHHAFLGRCAAILATSPDYLASSPVLARHRARCRVIPYGIPLEQFRRPDPRAVAEIRRRFGPRIVLAVGRLIYYKGFEHLIRAMAGVDARLLLLGDGPLAGALAREARDHGVTEKVAFLGEVHNRDLAPYYHAADLFALPSTARSEAFGIVQLEAMACGRPVVNTRLDSGVPFVSPHGVTGITVPPADPAALAAAISALLADPARRAAYGRAAVERVEREFSREVMVERTLALYAEVLDRGAGARAAVEEGGETGSGERRQAAASRA